MSKILYNRHLTLSQALDFFAGCLSKYPLSLQEIILQTFAYHGCWSQFVKSNLSTTVFSMSSTFEAIISLRFLLSPLCLSNKD